MSRSILILVFLALLTGCFHEEDAVDPQIFSPELSLEGSYEDVLASSTVDINTAEDFQALISKLVPRLISHLYIYNNEVDILASTELGAGTVKPVFKSGSRVFTVEIATSCVKESETDPPVADAPIDVRNLDNKSSLLWDDADDSGNLNEGDRYIRLFSQCKDELTGKFSTGTIYYTNIHAQAEAFDDYEKPIVDLGAKVRMQIDYDEGPSSSSIIFEEFQGRYNRAEETGSYFLVERGSRSYATNADEKYFFNFDSASASFSIGEETDTQTLTFTGSYYDNELEGFVTIDSLSIVIDYYSGTVQSLTASVNSQTGTVVLNGSSLDFEVADSTSSVEISEIFSDGKLRVIPLD